MRQPRHAMILAAGRGARLRPLTDHMPKPLVRVAGKPLIDYALELLSAAGIGQIVVNTSYLAEMLQAHLQVQAPQARISYEPQALETGGGIARALPWLGAEPFYALNSDTILLNGAVPALVRLAEAWRDDAMDALLLLLPRERAVGYAAAGDFFLEPGGQLRRRGSAAHAPYVFTGVQLLHPRLFAGAFDGVFSMNLLYDRGMDAQGKLPRVHGLLHDGAWLHVGDAEGLQAAEAWLRHGGVIWQSTPPPRAALPPSAH